MLREAKGFAETAFPTGADDRVADLPRNDQPDARMAGVIFAAVKNQHAVGLRTAPSKDAIKFRLLQQSSRTVEREIVHLADRFVAIDRRRFDGIDVGL